jgi:putative peptidoglycan lipid II flippase
LGSSDTKGFSLASVGQSAFILTVATAVVQLIGFAREVYVAAQVGLSPELDALIIGIALPTTNFLGVGVTKALVPSYLEARRTGGSHRARRVAGSILAVSIAGGFAITALLYVAAEPIVALTGPGLDAVSRESATSYLRVLSPAALFAAVSAVPFAVLQAERRFRAIGTSIIAGPLVTLIFMLMTWDRLGLESIAIGTLIGQVTMPALMLIATFRYGVAPALIGTLRGLGLRAFARHALPLSVGSLVLRLNPILDRAIASIVQSGGVAALRFADSLIRSPITAISPAWSGAVYPALVQAAQAEGSSQLGRATDRTVRYTIAVFTPISFLSAAVAPVAVSTVYSRGAFTSDDVQEVAAIVAAFAPLITILMTAGVVTNALNARRSSMVLLVSSIFNVLINLTLDVVLGLAFGVAGIAFASSVTMGTILVFTAIRLGRLEDGFGMRVMARTVTMACVASLPASLAIAVVCWSGWLPDGFLVGMASLVVFGLTGLAAYLAVATLIGLREPRELVAFAVRLGSGRLALSRGVRR